MLLRHPRDSRPFFCAGQSGETPGMGGADDGIDGGDMPRSPAAGLFAELQRSAVSGGVGFARLEAVGGVMVSLALPKQFGRGRGFGFTAADVTSALFSVRRAGIDGFFSRAERNPRFSLRALAPLWERSRCPHSPSPPIWANRPPRFHNLQRRRSPHGFLHSPCCRKKQQRRHGWRLRHETRPVSPARPNFFPHSSPRTS